MDWSWLLSFDVSPWELMARGTVMYWFLFLVYRFLLRRGVGGLGVADILLVVLVADASQNAMTAAYHSVGEGLVLVSTLIAWNLAFDVLGFHFPAFERFAAPPPLQLIRKGRIVHRHLRAENITLPELWAHLREANIDRLDKVKSACLESDGQLSVIRADSDGDAPEKRRPTTRR